MSFFKTWIILVILVSSLYSSEAEKMFWDEVKNTNDIEMLKLYKKRYPKGIFEALADLKIKRLKKEESQETKSLDEEPTWIKGKVVEYKYYGVGKANKHFKGIEYQKNLSEKRATEKLIDMLLDKGYLKEDIEEILTYTKKETYTNKNKRIYTLIYVEEF